MDTYKEARSKPEAVTPDELSRVLHTLVEHYWLDEKKSYEDCDVDHANGDHIWLAWDVLRRWLSQQRNSRFR